MRAKIKYITYNLFFGLLAFVCLSVNPAVLCSQDVASKELWTKIESMLGEKNEISSFHNILQLVRDNCGSDYSCLSQNYNAIQSNLERIFNIPAALYVGEELINIAQKENALEDEAEAHLDQYRFFDASGDIRLSITSLEKAGRLFEKIGNLSKLTYVRQSQLNSSLTYRDIDEVLPKMDSLLQQAKSRKDTASITNSLIRLMYVTLGNERLEEMESYLAELERIVANRTGNDRYNTELRTTLGRTELARRKGDLAEAIYQCKKILKILEKQPDRWFEYNSFQLLAEMEWERGNRTTSKSYLEQAERVATDLNLLMQLAIVYGIKSRFAEEERRPAKALEYLKQNLFYQKQWESRSEGFDMQAFYLQQEKEQLATEKERQDLTLQLQDQQLRNSTIIIGLTVVLAILLGLGFWFQQKKRRELAGQNSLIQQQAAQLRALDVAKSRFFANISHELRTPLTLVLGPIKTVLKSGSLNNRNFTMLTMAQQNAQNLLQLVGSILDLSKIEHGKLTLEEKPENLFLLLRRIVSAFESHAQREGIELTFHYQAEKDLRLQVDRLKLKDILNNLLSNAIKFTEHGGKVKLITTDKGNVILISVEDTGRGITSNDLPHVFNRFYQSEEENAPAEGGTGIGLAYSKELTTIMGGNIWIESKPEGGSIFYLELPRKEVLGVPEEIEEENWEAQRTITPLLPENGKAHQEDKHLPLENDRPTIMVVEDNYSLRDYITTILEPYYDVITASNGKEALNLLNQNSKSTSQTICEPSLIISDVMMPVMDGFQLMEKLKEDDRYNHLPLIMLTARADIRDKLKALRIGVDDYLLKPFDEEEVLVRISNLLENYATRDKMLREEVAPKKEIPAISQQDRQWLETFETYIRQNLSNEMVNIPDLARQFTMSESTLLRQLKLITGLTPAKYLQEMRQDKARQLLEHRVYNSVSQVAREVGYQDTRSFSRSFKKRFGKSPSEYLRTGVI